MKTFYRLILVFLFFTKSTFAAPYKTILLTGGNGYIGSHIAVELLNEGYHVIVVDNLTNSNKVVQDRIKEITGKGDCLKFYPFDLRNKSALDKVFHDHGIDAVIHLAGLKSVGESVKNPLSYYENNLISSIYLLEVMEKYKVYNLVFSSSATVYGMPKYLPLNESHLLSVTNPYGRTKLQIEEILGDLAASNKNWRMISLRYFNPIGAHESGMLGEDPQDTPNNLMPYILQVVIGKREKLHVFGGDYETKDGTGIRDYIHVVDLARGHLSTLHKLEDEESYSGQVFYNLGTGTGYSVLEIVSAVSDELNESIPYEIVGRRAGDAVSVYADTSLVERETGWKAQFGIREMARDSLRWILKNPNGYGTPSKTIFSESVLGKKEIEHKLAQLGNWSLTEKGEISRTVVADSFEGGLSLVCLVGAFADEMNHHPDIDIRYNKVKFTVSTHDAGGITEKDFAIAGKINDLCPK